MKALFLLPFLWLMCIVSCTKCDKETEKPYVNPLVNTYWIHVFPPDETESLGSTGIRPAATAYHFHENSADYIGLDKDFKIIEIYYDVPYIVDVENEYIQIAQAGGYLGDITFKLHGWVYVKYNQPLLPREKNSISKK